MLLKERQNNYDFLRVFAALCITFTHSFNLLKLNEQEFLMRLTNQNVDFSFIGLTIFFSISGYLIAKSADTSISFKNYLWKRFLRIQPLLIVVCMLSVFVLGPIFTTDSIANYFSNISSYTYFRNIMPLFGIQFTLPNVFTNNIAEPGINGSMWTLIVEERLYVFIGLIFLSKQLFKKLFILLIALFNLIYIIHIGFYDKHLFDYLNGGNVYYALIFINASLFYFLKIDFTKYSKSIMFYVLVLACLYLSSFYIIKDSIQILLIPLLVIAFANIKGFTNKAGKYGDFTYGIYIFSFPVQQILISEKLINNNPLLLFLFTLIIVLPMAYLSWHLLEKKMLRLKDRAM